MTVKNISQYHDYSFDQLSDLTTRHLMHIMESSRSKRQAIDAPYYDRQYVESDENSDEAIFNQNQESLHNRLKIILASREHLSSTKKVKKKEKKKMAY